MTVPRLVGTSGHPVLSVMQTDIITYGADLTAYLRHELDGVPLAQARPTVAFWKDLAG
jgi:hypothetical protein